ncbi:MAG: hypothetical protein JRF65_03370 [Deltaproteobacteria bacterium]|nr:hypothetical protein [Deltaproteobacteria bacterium]MBW2283625.1 hypothetical protein [Deltaproteobacteria bacterium]
MTKEAPYIKHVYWLTADEEARLRENLASRGITLKSAKSIVCAPLDPISKATSVAPGVWNETCNRQGGWYRESDKNGLYLVVSPMDLPGVEDRKAAVITESDFVPPRLAGDTDRAALVADPRYQAREPEAWKTPGDVEKRIYLRWARRMGSDVEDYDDLVLSHSANHANFIHPRLFMRDENGIVPYSIDRTAHLCSCCVELFQILGEEYEKKLVAPCPGAAIFSRLKKDRYLLVERP